MTKYIIFDTETTGLEKEDRIIQIGALILDQHKNIKIYNELCSSYVKIKFEAMATHHITENMIKNKNKFQNTKFYKELLKLNSAENYIIAHNINFDISMLEKENFSNKIEKIDTLKVAQHIFEDAPSHKLQVLRYYLKLNEEEELESKKYNIKIEAHNAISDVLITKLLLSRIVKELKIRFPKIKNYIKYLVELTNKPILLKKINFGKYKGRNIEDIIKKDYQYIKWLFNKSEDENMKYTLNTLLKKKIIFFIILRQIQ